MADADLMRLMAGDGSPAGGAGGAPTAGAPPTGAPVGSPMTSPQGNDGIQQAALVDISMALDLLEKSMAAFGTETMEGQALHKALGTLVKQFGQKRESGQQLQGAELQQLMQSMGQKSPEMMAMMGGQQQPPAGAAPQPPMMGQ